MACRRTGQFYCTVILASFLANTGFGRAFDFSSFDSFSADCHALSSIAPYSYSVSNIDSQPSERTWLLPKLRNVDAVLFPFHVAIKFSRRGVDRQYIYSGSIIHNNMILTAAPRRDYFSELLDAKPPYKCTVIAGASSLRYLDLEHDPGVQIRRCTIFSQPDLEHSSDRQKIAAPIILSLDEPLIYTDVVKPVCFLLKRGPQNQFTMSTISSVDPGKAITPVVVGFPTEGLAAPPARVILNSPLSDQGNRTDIKLSICLSGTSKATMTSCNDEKDFVLLTNEINTGIANLTNQILADPGQLKSITLRASSTSSRSANDTIVPWYGSWIELWFARDNFMAPVYPNEQKSEKKFGPLRYAKFRVVVQQPVGTAPLKFVKVNNLCTDRGECNLTPQATDFLAKTIDPARLTQWLMPAFKEKTKSCVDKTYHHCWKFDSDNAANFVNLGSPMLVINNHTWNMIGAISNWDASKNFVTSWALGDLLFNLQLKKQTSKQII